MSDGLTVHSVLATSNASPRSFCESQNLTNFRITMDSYTRLTLPFKLFWISNAQLSPGGRLKYHHSFHLPIKLLLFWLFWTVVNTFEPANQPFRRWVDAMKPDGFCFHQNKGGVYLENLWPSVYPLKIFIRVDCVRRPPDQNYRSVT